MALLWMDSMDLNDVSASVLATDKGYTVNSNIEEHWNYARHQQKVGMEAVDSDDWLNKDIGSNEDTIYMGIALQYKTAGAPTYDASWPFLEFQDESNVQQVRLHLTATKEIAAYNGAGTLLGTTASGGYFPVGCFAVLEVKVVVSDAAGVVEIRYNEDVVLSLSSKDTKNGSAYIRNIRFYGVESGKALHFADFWVDDAQFHGDVRIIAMLASADGADTAWTRNTGSNDWEMVDEITPDDDTTYLESATATDESTISVTPGLLNTVEAVNLVVNMKQADAPGDQRGVTLMCTSGGSDYDAASEVEPTTAYLYYTNIWEVDPDDSGAWTKAKIEAADFGVELTT